jgi:hypothetical protein
MMLIHDTRIGPDCRLSWQQEARLKNESKYGHYLPIAHIFRIPDELLDEDLLLGLREVLKQQEALQITQMTLANGGSATYTRSYPLPIRYQSCKSLDELKGAINKELAIPFKRNGQPLWHVTIFQTYEVRYACCKFDHLISDGQSMQLFQQYFLSTDPSSAQPLNSPYRQWVAWQHTHFPKGPHPPTPEGEFWLRHLDGTSADRPTPLPFAIKGNQRNRHLLTIIEMDFPVVNTAVQDIARAYHVTPFQIIASHIIANTAALSAVQDLTVRIINHGRPTRYLDTLGFFADSMPVRVRGARLSDSDKALTVLNAELSQISVHGYMAPWEYIREVSSLRSSGDVPNMNRQQLVINYLPPAEERFLDEQPREITVQRDIDGLHLAVTGNGDTTRIQAAFNPDDFAREGVRSFILSVGMRLTKALRS